MVDKGFQEVIKKHLDKRAQEDELFAKTYAKPHKSIEECCKYILQEVRKKGNAVFMEDAEVYGMAVHYYDEDSIKVDQPTPKVKVSVPTKSQPKAESKSNVVDLFSKPKTEPMTEEKPQPKAKPQTKKEKALEGQLSLF